MAYDESDCQVCVRQRHAGQDLCNVIAVHRQTSLTLGQTGTAVQEAWMETNSLIDCQVQDLEYVQTETRQLDGTTMTEITPFPALSTGNVVGDPVDPGSCLGFTLYSDTPGKSGRGRLYLGGVGRGALDSFSVQWDLTTSPGSTFAAACQVFADELASRDLLLLVNSRKLLATFVVITIVARTSILSQNQRARRYGTV